MIKRTCRKCGEQLSWHKSKNKWRECRHGCSQVSAAMPDDTECRFNLGSYSTDFGFAYVRVKHDNDD